MKIKTVIPVCRKQYFQYLILLEFLLYVYKWNKCTKYVRRATEAENLGQIKPVNEVRSGEGRVFESRSAQSSIGVIICSLPLFPLKYEISFFTTYYF